MMDISNRINAEYGSDTKVYEWTFQKGLTWQEGDRTLANDEADTPIEVLDVIDAYSGSAVFILKDFGYFLSDAMSMSYIIGRKLKDTATNISQEGKSITIVLLDSELCIPSRLEKMVTVIDFDLPTEQEIADYFGDTLGELRSEGDSFSRGVKASLGLTLNEVGNVFAKSFAIDGTLSPNIVMEEKKNIIKKSGVLEYYDLSGNLNDVGGLENLKEWLRLRGRAFSEEAKSYGLPTPKGVLIVGIPGTGKSLVSKCIGMEWSMPVLRLDVGSLFGSLVGQSESNMRKALKTAESMAPCVLWIDELEKSFGSGGSLDGGTSTRVFGYFLSWMQEKKSDVFVVATANDVSQLPPEMLRKGRFDEMFFVDLPSLQDSVEILKIHIQKYGRDPKDFNLIEVANSAPGFSGAELQSLVTQALYHSFYEDREPTTEDLCRAAKSTVPIAETMKEAISSLRGWANKRAVQAGDTYMPSSRMKKPSINRYKKMTMN